MICHVNQNIFFWPMLKVDCLWLSMSLLLHVNCCIYESYQNKHLKLVKVICKGGFRECTLFVQNVFVSECEKYFFNLPENLLIEFPHCYFELTPCNLYYYKQYIYCIFNLLHITFSNIKLTSLCHALQYFRHKIICPFPLIGLPKSAAS